MRHANEEHGVFAGVRRRFVKSAPGMLLEHVVDVLHARHVALANAVRPLVQPADRRPQRHTVRSEERRVGKECRCVWAAEQYKKKLIPTTSYGVKLNVYPECSW